MEQQGPFHFLEADSTDRGPGNAEGLQLLAAINPSAPLSLFCLVPSAGIDGLHGSQTNVDFDILCYFASAADASVFKNSCADAWAKKTCFRAAGIPLLSLFSPCE